MDYSTPGFPVLPISRNLLKLTSIKLVMPSNHLILCCPLLLSSIFPSIRIFPVSQLFKSGGQSIGVSASSSVLPMNTQGWSPSEWTGWISLQSKGLSRVFSNTTVQKHQFFGTQLSSQSNSHIHTWLLETIALTKRNFVGKVMTLLFKRWLSCHNFSSKEQVSFNFMAAVTICSDFGAPQNKVSHYFHCFPIYFPWSDGTRCHDFSFLE